MKKICLFAVSFIFLQQCFADGEDLRIQLDDVNSVFQSIQNTVQPTYVNKDLDERKKAWNRTEEALKDSNWSDAAYWVKHGLKHEWVGVNQASDWVQLSMIYWNSRQRSQACNALRQAIYIMDNDKELGRNCSARAKYFLRKMEAGKLPTTFTYQDIEGSPGIHSYIMEIPRAVFHSKLQAQNARCDALIGAANAQIKVYQIRSRMEEQEAKSYADTEYRKATGKDFDSQHRPYNRYERDAWDSCKRIYDIWDKKK